MVACSLTSSGDHGWCESFLLGRHFLRHLPSNNIPQIWQKGGLFGYQNNRKVDKEMLADVQTKTKDGHLGSA